MNQSNFVSAVARLKRIRRWIEQAGAIVVDMAQANGFRPGTFVLVRGMQFIALLAALLASVKIMLEVWR